MEHHILKAEKKGYRCDKEIIERTTKHIDTIRDVLTNEVVRIDTMYQTEVETRYISRYINLTRRQRKAIQDSMKHVENVLKLENARLKDSLRRAGRTNRVEARQDNRTDRTNARQENRTERTKYRRLWWLWMLAGAVSGIIIYRKM